ncbi:hypothetical protein E2C00_27060 [Streptomyces sp. WAC05374]|nr:hypothetical protein EF905_03805 [Streptomyces sp. WAC05374]TDF43330.1 hypothetical protein E2B92_19915 [Streptomyces sp. WAC05374]TDF51116.1 hypothetical protein E2C00_27060 [Streptomyces sp. WAC05374]TDF52348.1 hypothetical protein E2C02_22105 [Streptomyces sp. WAC05374]
MELLMEVTDDEQLTAAALERVEADEFMPDEERTQAQSAVREDEAEALAYLVEPVDLLSQVPGVELAQASWSSELVDHDPDADVWELEEEDDEDHLDDVRP